MEKIILRPIEDKDIVILSGWLRKDYIIKWYEDPDEWLHEINGRGNDFNFIRHLIVELDGNPIGFCQYYDCFNAQEDWYTVNATGETYSIDYLIGEEAYLGKGWGKAIVLSLEDEIQKNTLAKYIIVKPEAGNAPSNGVLLSCGYRFDEEAQYYIKVL
jgi:Acetyltransferases, including N-acetylases of ribosomal proteins